MSGSCQKINLRTWPRRDIFSFFSSIALFFEKYFLAKVIISFKHL